MSKEKETNKLAAETILRIVFVLLMTSIIIFLAIPNIKKIVQHQDPLVVINIENKTTEGIPMPNAFVCGVFNNLINYVDYITVEKIPLGKKAIMVDEKYIWKNYTAILKAGGDLTEGSEEAPCFIFQPDGALKFKLTNDNDSIDYISINVWSKTANVTNTTADLGVLFGFWNAERDISVIKPFVARTATINHFTFTSIIRNGINNDMHQDFTINIQNTLQIGSFYVNRTLYGDDSIIAKINYSPDSYMVTKYTERQPYGWLDLVGTIGGILTYAIGVWVLGFIQRFLLRNSPNAKKHPLMEKEEFNEVFTEPSLLP
ncbi:13471_t:CDS:2, partial [Ambispora leptoticha]